MAFQGYIDTIKAKTGKTPEEFLALAKAKGLLEPGVKTGQVVDWLKRDFDLGRGHAMALMVVFNRATKPQLSHNQQIAEHFMGTKAKWREPYDQLMAKVSSFGPRVEAWPVHAYINLVREGKKFAILHATGDRLDVGIKLKGVAPTERFKLAGSWNAMVTHRVRITDPRQIDNELLAWLKQAYDKVKEVK